MNCASTDVQGNVLWWLFLGMMSRMMEKEDGEYLERVKTAMQRAQDAKTTSS